MTLWCNSDGNPAPTISWIINGSPENASGNPRISLSPDKKQLTITNLNRADSGEYKCVATNLIGTLSHTLIENVQCKCSAFMFC